MLATFPNNGQANVTDSSCFVQAEMLGKDNYATICEFCHSNKSVDEILAGMRGWRAETSANAFQPGSGTTTVRKTFCRPGAKPL
jgi:hypothetical protein